MMFRSVICHSYLKEIIIMQGSRYEEIFLLIFLIDYTHLHDLPYRVVLYDERTNCWYMIVTII